MVLPPRFPSTKKRCFLGAKSEHFLFIGLKNIQYYFKNISQNKGKYGDDEVSLNFFMV